MSGVQYQISCFSEYLKKSISKIWINPDEHDSRWILLKCKVHVFASTFQTLVVQAVSFQHSFWVYLQSAANRKKNPKKLSVSCLILNSGQWSQHIKPYISMSVRVLLYSPKTVSLLQTRLWFVIQNHKNSLSNPLKKTSRKCRFKLIQSSEVLPFIMSNYLLSALKQCFILTKGTDHWCTTAWLYHRLHWKRAGEVL